MADLLGVQADMAGVAEDIGAGRPHGGRGAMNLVSGVFGGAAFGRVAARGARRTEPPSGHPRHDRSSNRPVAVVPRS
ncbi:hypothetical protein ACH40D_14385 [Streptomyces olivaceoviridis]|uniref:Uncharacterized protein n=1 Tax=Streptomyces olivaceoviridis TaxID=1921 RepID=A0ABW7V5I7_STROI|nr:hypothetical protein [Streptomyces corchorusii]